MRDPEMPAHAAGWEAWTETPPARDSADPPAWLATCAWLMIAISRDAYSAASETPNVRPAMVPRNIHIRTSSFVERNFRRISPASRTGSAFVISSLNPTPSAAEKAKAWPARPRWSLMLIVTTFSHTSVQTMIPMPTCTSSALMGPGRINSQKPIPQIGAMYRPYAQPGVDRLPDDANSAMNTSGSSAYVMTRSRRPWRQPGFLSQLPTGIRIRNASTNSSLAGAAGGPGLGFGPAARGGISAAGAGGDPGADDGSIRRTGPCADPSPSSTAWLTATLVTDCPPWKVGAWPTFSKTHPSSARLSWACLRETAGLPTTTSLSVPRPIRTGCPGWKA